MGLPPLLADLSAKVFCIIMQLAYTESLCRAFSRHYCHFGWRLVIARLKCGRQKNGLLPIKAAVVSRIVRWRRNPASH